MTHTVTISSQTTVRFEGYSDDTAGCYWEGGDLDHDDCAAGSLRTFYIVAGSERMAVNMIYGAGANWMIGIGPIHDNDTLPRWPMRWGFHKYTATLDIDVPCGTEISLERVSQVTP